MHAKRFEPHLSIGAFVLLKSTHFIFKIPYFLHETFGVMQHERLRENGRCVRIVGSSNTKKNLCYVTHFLGQLNPLG